MKAAESSIGTIALWWSGTLTEAPDRELVSVFAELLDDLNDNGVEDVELVVRVVWFLGDYIRQTMDERSDEERAESEVLAVELLTVLAALTEATIEELNRREGVPNGDTTGDDDQGVDRSES